ncbi:hypothetical protein Q1695_000073 [Nippostrongylus brasiliensis]|nr:hypothetical protein Q1695_000073 [Nippostrongylus brasiliensis]
MVDVKSTRAAFAGLIDKPVLTDELLTRPPFRFILDVVSSTVAKTGYLKDRFPSSALSPEKMREKADKIAFLDALIEQLNDGSLANVKSTKIVAGKEPENTNMLLLKLAERAREFKEQRHNRSTSNGEVKEKRAKSKNRDTSKSEKEDAPKKSRKSKDASDGKVKKDEAKVKEKKVERKKDGTGEHRSRKSERDVAPDASTEKVKEKKAEKTKKKTVKAEENTINTDVIVDMEEDKVDKPINEPTTSQVDSPNARTDDSGVSDMTESPRPPPPLERITSARPHTSMDRPGTAAARRPPPKLKRKQIGAVEASAPQQPVEVMPESVEIAPTTEAENFLVEEVEDISYTPPVPVETQTSIERAGGLVKKMIDTTSELRETKQSAVDDVDEVALNRRKAKNEAFASTLQSLTKTTYPLARVFDFAQEDIELMIKELEKWRNETKKCENALKTREADGVSDVQKLATVLQQLDDDIQSMRMQVKVFESRIAEADQRIQLALSDL